MYLLDFRVFIAIKVPWDTSMNCDKENLNLIKDFKLFTLMFIICLMTIERIPFCIKALFFIT